MFKKRNTKTATEFEQQAITNVVGTDLKIVGDLSGDSPIRIDGVVQGNINIKSGIILGEKSDITGNVSGDFIIVYGKLTGDIHAKNLYIKSSGVINGNINVEIIEIEVGGKYNGQLQMQGIAAS